MSSPAGADTDPPVGEVVTVFSPKGGVGKTTMSVNLAHAVRAAGRTVCLVDLDLEFGDVAIVTGVLPVRTIADAVGTACDGDALADVVTAGRGGVDCVLAPVDPVLAETVDAMLVAALLRALRTRYDVVVVDTAPQLSECVLEALVCADHLVLVTTPDLPSIKNTRLALDTLRLLDTSARTNTLLLNRYGRRSALPVEEIVEALRGPRAVTVPDDDAVAMSVDAGVPLQLSDPSHPVSRVLQQVVDGTILDSAPAEAARRFRLRRKGA